MNASCHETAASFDVLSTPIGVLTLCCLPSGALCEIAFETQHARALRAGLTHAPAQLRAGTQQLIEYFGGKRRAFDLELAPQGTRFQHAVWRALAEIPYGESRSYGRIAEEMGSPTASRAVGAANGRNPLPIVVPCHRVIGSNGTLTGYAGGLAAKRFLLELEAEGIASARTAELLSELPAELPTERSIGRRLAAGAALHPES